MGLLLLHCCPEVIHLELVLSIPDHLCLLYMTWQIFIKKT